MKLKTLIEQSDTTGGRIFDIVSQSLILISLVSFSIETLPGNPPLLSAILRYIEVATVCLFTLEYILRFSVADSKLKFFFSFYGMVDLIAILPFFFLYGVDLRAIRIIRLFRLFRIFKLLRYNNAMVKLGLAIKSTKEELLLFGMATVLLLFVAAVGIYFFEKKSQPEVFSSIFHCLWWAVVTLTTVGYGDMYPVTVGGKLFTSLISLSGVGIVAVPTGLIASALTRISTKSSDPKPSHAQDSSRESAAAPEDSANSESDE